MLDAGFELTSLSAGQFSYNTPGSAWVFTGTSGVSSKSSAFTAANPAAPEGDRVAFLQSRGSFSQSVGLTAGTYVLQFSAAQRGGQVGKQTFQVLLDGQVIGTFNTLSGTSYTQLTTSTFSVTSGSHTLTFLGTNLAGGDQTVFLDKLSIIEQGPGFNDSGFEAPALAAGTYSYTPNGTPWIFSGPAGVATNGSAFTAGNSTTPQGNQVAFLQSHSSANQVVLLEAGTYVMSFKAAQRGGQAGKQTFQVMVDGRVVGTFNNVTGTGYSLLFTSSFTLSAGSHNVTIQGTNLNGGDNTILLDEVLIHPLAVDLADTGFEMPAQSTGGFTYTPLASPWSYLGAAGVTANASPFTSANPAAPQGGQVAFLQGANSSISQTVYLTPGTYSVSFLAAQRAGQVSTQSFQVLVDSNVVGTFDPATAESYGLVATSDFTVGEGFHTVTFRGTNTHGGDNTILLDDVVLAQRTGVNDPGFETPMLATGKFSYRPAGSAWSFSGSAGVASKNSAFTAANPAAPQGNQVAFVQDQGSVSQVVSLDAGTYSLSFSAAQRAGQRNAQTFQVLVDGVVVGTFNSLTGASYSQLTTSTFTVAGGSHTITFKGTNLYGGDHTVFLDQVAVTAVPGVTDSGFEATALAMQQHAYRPAGSAWTFTGTAGVSANGSAFTGANPGAPQGGMVAFIQNQGSVSQDIQVGAGTYDLRFQAAQRSNQASHQSFEVMVDDVVVGIFNSLTGKSYTQLSTEAFTLAEGTHTITIRGTTTSGDSTVFIDQVTLAPAEVVQPIDAL
jgi:hypothetical protein